LKLAKQQIMIIYVLNNEEKLASNHQETAEQILSISSLKNQNKEQP